MNNIKLLKICAFAVTIFALVYIQFTVLSSSAYLITPDAKGCSTGKISYIDRQGSTCAGVVIDNPIGFPLLINNSGNTFNQRSAAIAIDILPALFIITIYFIYTRK